MSTSVCAQEQIKPTKKKRRDSLDQSMGGKETWCGIKKGDLVGSVARKYHQRMAVAGATVFNERSR